MHPPEVKQAALALIATGHNDCEVSRLTGIPRRTIADWHRLPAIAGTSSEICPRCWRSMRPIRAGARDYAELLGLYLGDGCVSAHARTSRLRIALDAAYPSIIDETVDLLARTFPANPVGLVRASKGAMVHVSVYSNHLPCLFPQHGEGPKHERRIAPEPWQARILAEWPWPFIRACIRTDGCAFINRTGPYQYLSYDFSNMSKDIVDLFVAACDRVEVRTRMTQCPRRRLWRVRINRRESVARMKEHVGLKR